VWVGHGGPNVFLDPLDFNPQLTEASCSTIATTSIRKSDPRSKWARSNYTLTYQPQNFDANGKFRRIRVTLRDPNLRAVTKAGYFAPDKNSPNNPRQQRMSKLAEALQSSIPFNSLDVSLSGIVHYPDSQSVEFTVELKSKNVIFQPANDGKNTVILTVAAASLNGDRTILASKMENVTLVAANPDPAQMPQVLSSLVEGARRHFLATTSRHWRPRQWFPLDLYCRNG